MTGVFVLPPREDWICDRFVTEWYQHNTDISTPTVNNSDVIWLLADWCWDHLPRHVLERRKVVTSVHHIVPDKFGVKELATFQARDAVTTVYHVPCEKTREQISLLTDKPIRVIPFWVNGEIFKPKHDDGLRKKYGLPEYSYLIGSFQRDTEGGEGVRPKLEKGPDLLADHIERLQKEWEMCAPHCGFTAFRNPHVVLAGWRRQYIIDRLKAAKVPYTYIERPPMETVTDLYATLDMYIVAARYEGGPQSIVECASMEVPIVSTDVGLASRILAPESVGPDTYKLRANVKHAKAQVEKLYITNGGMTPFRNLIEEVRSM